MEIYYIAQFQFYLSSIKSTTFEDIFLDYQGFNSTLVQLKEQRRQNCTMFTKSFNSTLVQLKDQSNNQQIL